MFGNMEDATTTPSPQLLSTTTLRINFLSEFCYNDEIKVIKVAMIIF